MSLKWGAQSLDHSPHLHRPSSIPHLIFALPHSEMLSPWIYQASHTHLSFTLAHSSAPPLSSLLFFLSIPSWMLLPWGGFPWPSLYWERFFLYIQSQNTVLHFHRIQKKNGIKLFLGRLLICPSSTPSSLNSVRAWTRPAWFTILPQTSQRACYI